MVRVLKPCEPDRRAEIVRSIQVKESWRHAHRLEFEAAQARQEEQRQQEAAGRQEGGKQGVERQAGPEKQTGEQAPAQPQNKKEKKKRGPRGAEAGRGLAGAAEREGGTRGEEQGAERARVLGGQGTQGGEQGAGDGPRVQPLRPFLAPQQQEQVSSWVQAKSWKVLDRDGHAGGMLGRGCRKVSGRIEALHCSRQVYEHMAGVCASETYTLGELMLSWCYG